MNDDRRSADGHPDIVRDVLAHLGQADLLFKKIASAQDGSIDASVLAAKRRLRRLVGSTRSSDFVDDVSGALDVALASLTTLTRLCDHKFVTYSYDSIPIVWRAIYVHAQLLKACCILMARSSRNAEEESNRLRLCIRDLDLALIVAGAASIGEDQNCHDLISALQQRLLHLPNEDQTSASAPRHPSDDLPLAKRRRLLDSDSDNVQFEARAQADSNIPEYSSDQAPSFMDLADPDSLHRTKPFVVRAFAQKVGWPAVQPFCHRSWSSAEHLMSAAGPARVVPVEVGANYARQDWGQDMILWADFLKHCHWDTFIAPDPKHDSKEASIDPPPVLYMAQHDLASQFPALSQDFFLPEYVYTSPAPPPDWPDYAPPATSDGVITNVWIGPPGTVSPPHFDPFYNCFVQVVGHKEVWAAPPSCRPIKTMTAAGLQSVDMTEQSNDAAVGAESSVTDTLMSNTSDVDVFGTEDLVASQVRSAAFRSVLGPGDLLYLPPGWWHSLRSLTRSASVSTWF